MENITHPDSPKRFLFVSQSLKGLGQIMLQGNAITGLLLVVGVFLGSVTMGVAMVVSACVATLIARLFKCHTNDLDNGLYGFNAALVGAALLLFYQPTLIIWCGVVFSAAISVTIQHFLVMKKITVFTLPFVLLTWAMLLFFNHFQPELGIASSPTKVGYGADFGFALRGYGQVIFQDNVTTGAIFFLAVFINSPLAALYGLAGAVLAVFISTPFSIAAENINLGLVSYNAVLSAIVFSGSKVADGIWVLLSVALSSAIGYWMSGFAFPQLTFPFVAASCAVLMLKNRFKPAAVSSKSSY